jgi:hypothetical protein
MELASTRRIKKTRKKGEKKKNRKEGQKKRPLMIEVKPLP